MTSDTPRLFRLNVEVGDIDRAAAFYAELLGLEARPQMGAREAQAPIVSGTGP